MSHLPHEINKQRLLMLYASMAQIAFTEIRNLGFGRLGSRVDSLSFLENLPNEKLLKNLFVAGQLAEAMHNFPTTLRDDYQRHLTLLNLCKFIEKNPKYDEQFHSTITEIIQLNYQELSEIDADFAATIADKYR